MFSLLLKDLNFLLLLSISTCALVLILNVSYNMLLVCCVEYEINMFKLMSDVLCVFQRRVK